MIDAITYALLKGDIGQGTQEAVTEYLDEHLTNPSNPPIDTSLTIAGAAADSKETGDKITQLKEDLSKLYESKELVGVDVYGYWRNGVFTEYNTPVTKEFVVSGLKEVTLTTYANQYRDMYVFLTESKSVVSYALGDGDYTSTGKTITINVPNNAVYLDSTASTTSAMQLIKATADLPTVTKEEVEQIQQEVDELSTSAVYKSNKVVLDMTDSESGISIDKYGYKGTNSNYSVTEPFYVPEGAILNIVATGYQDTTAILSEYVGGIYKPLVISETYVTSYTYTTTKESHYAICFRTANTHSCEYTYSFEPIDIISTLTEIENPEPEYLYLFHKVAGIGDSLMSGELYYSDENHRDAYAYSWLSNLARYGNAKCVHYSVGGMTTKAWLDDVGGCRTALENETEMSNVYFIGLGTNDKNQEVYPIGNASDTAGTASFAGYYKQIIEIIHTHNPNAYVFCLSMYDRLSASLPYSQIVSDIAGQYSYCYFVDFANNTAHTPKTSGTYAENSHFTSLGYLYAAQLIKRLVEAIVSNNKDSFKWIGLND